MPKAPPALLTSACTRAAGGELVAHPVDVVCVGEVGDDDAAAGLGGERLEAVRAAGDADDVPAVRAEQPHGRRPDARTRSRHDHASSLMHDNRRVEAMSAAPATGPVATTKVRVPFWDNARFASSRSW